jgi:hypothetical protein
MPSNPGRRVAPLTKTTLVGDGGVPQATFLERPVVDWLRDA